VKDALMRPVLASRKNARVYAHWVRACGSRSIPRRSDIRPEEIKAELPYVYIAQVMENQGRIGFKFRLMGTKLAETLGQDGTGQLLLDLQIGGWEEEWRKNLVYAVKIKMPVVDESKIRAQAGFDLDIEHLALPLSEDGETVDKVFGAIDFYTTTETDLRKLLPKLDWQGISAIELDKRIIISNLRVQL
jgi:hypothetical protein